MQAVADPWCVLLVWLGVWGQLWGLPGAASAARLGVACSPVAEVASDPRILQTQTVAMLAAGGSTRPVCAVKLRLPDARLGQRVLCDAQLVGEAGPVGPRDHALRVLAAGEGFVHVPGACPAGIGLAADSSPRAAMIRQACARPGPVPPAADHPRFRRR